MAVNFVLFCWGRYFLWLWLHTKCLVYPTVYIMSIYCNYKIVTSNFSFEVIKSSNFNNWFRLWKALSAVELNISPLLERCRNKKMQKSELLRWPENRQSSSTETQALKYLKFYFPRIILHLILVASTCVSVIAQIRMTSNDVRDFREIKNHTSGFSTQTMEIFPPPSVFNFLLRYPQGEICNCLKKHMIKTQEFGLSEELQYIKCSDSNDNKNYFYYIVSGNWITYLIVW